MAPHAGSSRPPAPAGRHPGSTWLERHWNGLPNNHWVAASSDGLVASDPSLDVVLAAVRQRFPNSADVAVAFVSTDTRQ